MQAKLSYGLAVVMLLAACGGGSGGGDRGKWPETKPYQPSSSGSVDSDDDEGLIDDGTLKFDEEQAKILLNRGATNAADCPKTAGTPTGEGDITVTFDGEKGRIVEVDVGYYWADASDQARNCIRKAFIGGILPPFEGGNKDMTYTLTIPEPKEEKEKK